MAKVSVLMPVYNAGKYLRAAIESILNQTFEDFEFLIIDDGSTDNSAAIIASYKDPRICFYRNKENIGISPTLNKGIQLATTEMIARMDADDISYPERLKRQLDYLQAHPDCAMVASQARVISEEGKFIRLDKLKPEHYYYNLTFICWVYHPTVMYRKTVVKEVNMYTEIYSEDFELFWQISRRYKIYTLPEVLLDYRETARSLHQVTKRKEYEQAQQEQVLRNLRYFAGNDYYIPLRYIECFRHNFLPLLAEQKVSEVIACIKELDFINHCILFKENVNHNPQAIKKAAEYKRAYVISFYLKHLPFRKKIYLLFWSTSISGIVKIIKSSIRPFLSIKRQRNHG